MKKWLLITIPFLFFACRKEKNVRPEYHYTPTTAAQTQFKDPPLFMGPNSYVNGYLFCTRIMGPDSSIPPAMSSQAFFSYQQLSYPMPSLCMPIQKVRLNGLAFKFTDYYYEDSTHTLLQQPVVWEIEGRGAIPSFTQTVNEPFPSFSTFYSLPDTLHRSAALMIPLNKLIMSESTLLQITDGTHDVETIFGAMHASYFFFTIPMMQKLMITDHAEIWILTSHNTHQYSNGKYFGFSNNTLYRKKVVVVD